MKRRMDRDHHLGPKSADGVFSGTASWLRAAGLKALVSAGLLSVVACSKVTLPKTTQGPGNSPAPSTSQDWTKSLTSLFSPSTTPAPLTDAKLPPIPPAPAVAAAARPGLVPNPATGAKEAAIKMYPDLAVKDSTFNKTFRDLYVEESQREPEFLTRADWPLVLAHRTADLLAAAPHATPSPQIVNTKAPSATPMQPMESNPLNRGAYGQARSPYWWGPWIRTY